MQIAAPSSRGSSPFVPGCLDTSWTSLSCGSSYSSFWYASTYMESDSRVFEPTLIVNQQQLSASSTISEDFPGLVHLPLPFESLQEKLKRFERIFQQSRQSFRRLNLMFWPDSAPSLHLVRIGLWLITCASSSAPRTSVCQSLRSSPQSPEEAPAFDWPFCLFHCLLRCLSPHVSQFYSELSFLPKRTLRKNG